MRARAEATIEDLYRVDGKAELVDGVIVLIPPTGPLPARAAIKIVFSLVDYEQRSGSGRAVPGSVAFIVDLPHRKSFCADASFYSKSTGFTMKFLDGAPIFAVEVRSENDYGPAAQREMAAKRADYFAAGTQVVWDVDLLNEDVVRVYRADDPEHPTLYRSGELAEAEPALPGWTFPVDDLFK